MKKTIAIALMALATAAFGSQATQVERAKLEHIAAVERARAEQKSREIQHFQKQLTAETKSTGNPIADMQIEYWEWHKRYRAEMTKLERASAAKVRVPSHSTAKVWVPGHWKDVKEKRKVVNVKNALGRGVSSGPAIRRK